MLHIEPTNATLLYIGRHAYEIPGLEPEAGEKLLADLTTYACPIGERGVKFLLRKTRRQGKHIYNLLKPDKYQGF